MKYFTIQWWSGEVDDQDAACEEYANYLLNNKPRFLPELQRLLNEVSLHDSRLRNLTFRPQDDTITIDLDGCETQPPYQSLKITFEYAQVSHFESIADPEKGLGGPYGYGDLGYDEIEILDSGRYQHRILFSSGIEFQITFKFFKLICSKL